MKLTDGRKTINIEITEWNGNGFTPDWSIDFFDAGLLPMADDETYIVDDVDYCIEYAMGWKNCIGDFSDDEPRAERCVFIEELERKDIVRMVLEYEINRRQHAWEMLQDGYAGDVEAYIADYIGDYEVEHVTGDTYRVKHPNGRSWIVDDGNVERVIF